MSFKCGIVGLPNVGKSTLFNALTNSSKAQAANFPFCTIDQNVGVVPVPDERLSKLSKVSNSKKVINTTISFVDIAGLVKGASKGEGLGNKFLSHIREVDAVIHMIRCFDSDDIQNVNPDVNPVRDLEIIETEMMLADLESIQKRLEKNNKKNVDEEQLKILEIALDCINNDKDISVLKTQFDTKQLNQSGLLSIKPKIYVCNVDEQSVQNGNKYTNDFIKKFGNENTLIVSADIENQIIALNLAKDLDINHGEAVLRVEQGSSVSSMTSSEIKRDLLLFAKREPELFIDIVNDDNVQLRNFGIKATEAGIIKLSGDQRSFHWGTNNKKLMNIPFDENPYSAFAAYFKTDEGTEVYKSIEKKIK